MKADNEMHFVDNTNYQSLETAPPQNLTSVQNLPPVVSQIMSLFQISFLVIVLLVQD